MLSVKLGDKSIGDISHGLRNKRYDTEVVFGGHKFIHVQNGAYKSENPIIFTKGEMLSLLSENKTVCLIIDKQKTNSSNTLYDLADDAEITVYGACSVVFSDIFYVEENSYGIKHCKDQDFCEGDGFHYFTKYLGVSPDKTSFFVHRDFRKITRNLNLTEHYPFAYRFDEAKRVNGYKEYLHFSRNGIVAYLVEDGIYKVDGSLFIDLNSEFTVDNRPVEGIVYSTDFHISFTVELDYFAVGEEHFARLEEINKFSENGFIHKFRREDTDRLPVNGVETKIAKTVYEMEDIIREKSGTELFEGAGFSCLRVDFRSLFGDYVKPILYQFAYICDGYLVLNSTNYVECEKKYDLRFIYYLVAAKAEKLKCGVYHYVNHTIIDCKDEKMQEVLTDEAYTAWQENSMRMS